MYYSPKKVYRYYKEYGFDGLLFKMSDEINLLVLAALFRIIDEITTSKSDDVCIIPRSFTIDQDTISTISQNKDGTTYIAVPNPAQVEKSQVLEKLNGYELVSIHTVGFVWILSRCNIILFKDFGVTYHYRVLGRSDKTFIRIPHGLPAKGSYNGRNNCSLSDFINISNRNHVRSATTDHVLNYDAAECGMHPGLLQKYGFPRFDRARYLSKNPDETLVPDEVDDVLSDSDNSYNILYAPTHKDEHYETTLFPFPDRDINKIYEFLDDNNIRIFIRLHVNEERKNIEDEYVDGERILYAGNDFFGSASEMMPYFDALVTDFSSIYLDFILYDRPIIYVQDNLERYMQIRDFPAFDYEKYWPGPKIRTQDEFFQAIRTVLINGEDEYVNQRKFVREVLHRDRSSNNFLEEIKKDAV